MSLFEALRRRKRGLNKKNEWIPKRRVCIGKVDKHVLSKISYGMTPIAIYKIIKNSDQYVSYEEFTKIVYKYYFDYIQKNHRMLFLDCSNVTLLTELNMCCHHKDSIFYVNHGDISSTTPLIMPKIICGFSIRHIYKTVVAEYCDAMFDLLSMCKCVSYILEILLNQLYIMGYREAIRLILNKLWIKLNKYLKNIGYCNRTIIMYSSTYCKYGCEDCPVNPLYIIQISSALFKYNTCDEELKKTVILDIDTGVKNKIIDERTSEIIKHNLNSRK
jgi:hypothetical protein